MRNLEEILAAFEGPDPARSGRPAGIAAVMLLLFDAPDGPRLLYIRRSEGLRNHPGEVSFPGGRVDPEDEGPLAAALRETREEVGIEPSRVERVGHLVDFVTYRGATVCAYVGRVRGESPTVPASPEEVADVFTVPLADLLDPTRYEARRIEGMPPGRQVHYWHLPRQTMWGITGELTARFLQKGLGWVPPVEARTVAAVEEFAPSASGGVPRRDDATT